MAKPENRLEKTKENILEVPTEQKCHKNNKELE